MWKIGGEQEKGNMLRHNQTIIKLLSYPRRGRAYAHRYGGLHGYAWPHFINTAAV